MSEECSIEELTAFLEASDSDSEAENVNNCQPSTGKEESKKEEGDECSLEEIEAFLQASDEEDECVQEDEQTEETMEQSGPLEMEAEFEEFGEEDLEELDQMMDSQECQSPQQSSASPSESQNEENLEEGVDRTDCSAGRGVDVETAVDEERGDGNVGGQTDVEGDTCTSRKGVDVETAVDEEREDGFGSEQTGNVDDNLMRRTDSCNSDSDKEYCEETTEAENEESEQHKAIKAEMEAMAKRMAKLKEMLEKSKSSPGKRNSQTSPSNTKQVAKTTLTSKPGQTVEHKSKSDEKASSESKCAIPAKRSDKSFRSLTGSKLTSKSEKKSSSSAGVLPPSAGLKRSSVTSPSLKSKVQSGHLSAKKDKKSAYKDNVAKVKEVERKDKERSGSGVNHSSRHTDEKAKKPKIVDDDEENPFFAQSMSDGTDGPVDSKTLFGESDDSDWEDMAGEEKRQLSEEGKELKKLINTGARKREAHTPSYDPALLKKPEVSKWSDSPSLPPVSTHPIQKAKLQKPTLNPETGTVSGKYRVKEEYLQKPAAFPAQDDREHVTDPFCGIRIVNPRISMDTFKLKMEGRNLIKVSRLASKSGTADLQKENWVTLGVVVHKTEPRQSAAGKTYCIWKLSDLQNCDKTVTFFLFGNVYKDHWKNDTGVVIGLLNPTVMDKAEKNQSEIAITISHPQQLLVMGTSKDLGRCRGTTKSGQPCSSFINKMQGDYCTYHVQSAYRKSSSKRTELQASTGVTPKAFAQQKKNSQGCFFYGGQTFTTLKPQSKSSKDTMTLKKLKTFEAGKAAGKITTMSLHELEPEDEKKINKLREKDRELLNLLSVPTAGSMNFVKHLVKKDAAPSVKKDGDGNVMLPSVSAKDLLKEHSRHLQQKKHETNLLSAKPTLGKGLSVGQEISLDAPVKRGKGSASAELARQLAIAKIKSKGGLTKDDPNAVRKKLTSPEAREKIKKRVAEDMETDTGTDVDKDVQAPPQKRSKLLGDIDLNSTEVQQLLKKKSKHTGALAEAEAENEERYFGALEKKEQMEEKMGAIMEVSVKVYCCVQCKYKYYSVHDRCKKENHTIKTVQGTQRFFKCKQCKKRTVSLDKFPTKACKDCGNTNFERVSMLKERSGPKLESEELCLRGDEQKFVGSLQGKVYLNG